MPPPGIIPAGELPDGEPMQEKVDEDLDEQKARLKRELYDKIEEFYEGNDVEEIEFEMAADPRKGSDYDEDVIDELSEVLI